MWWRRKEGRNGEREGGREGGEEGRKEERRKVTAREGGASDWIALKGREL